MQLKEKFLYFWTELILSCAVFLLRTTFLSTLKDILDRFLQFLIFFFGFSNYFMQILQLNQTIFS